MHHRIKICCIQDMIEARAAIRAGASLLAREGS
jgi:hypothetical protein